MGSLRAPSVLIRFLLMMMVMTIIIKHHDHDHDYYLTNQVGSNHYPECQVFRTLNPKLVVSDFEEEGNVIYQVKLARDIMDKENACLNCSVW